MVNTNRLAMYRLTDEIYIVNKVTHQVLHGTYYDGWRLKFSECDYATIRTSIKNVSQSPIFEMNSVLNVYKTQHKYVAGQVAKRATAAIDEMKESTNTQIRLLTRNKLMCDIMYNHIVSNSMFTFEM